MNIGYATALRLLRLGATVAVTTRFPKDCLRRYGREEDASEWLCRLSVYGADFRSVPSVAELGERLAVAFPRLDVLINNAAQTVRKPQAHYAALVAQEAEALEDRLAACLKSAASLKFMESSLQSICDPSSSSSVVPEKGQVEEMKELKRAQKGSK